MEIMTRKYPDDVESLCNFFGLNPDLYKRFPSRLRRAEEKIKQPKKTSVVPPSKNEGDTPHRTFPGANCSDFHDRPLDAIIQSAQGHAFPELLAFRSVVGGAGQTTILATTCRALSMREKRVLVVDGNSNSMLPMYFGVRAFLRGINYLISDSGAPIYVLLKELAAQHQQSVDAWLRNAISDLGTEIDRVLMDSWPQVAENAERWIYPTGLSVMVVAPDVRSAIAVKRMARYLQKTWENTGIRARTYFLLNKFDASSSLDVDMRHWLTRELGSALLPFVVRRDEKVREALAQGLTVLDYAPDSAVARDFNEFVEWISEPSR